VRGRYDSGVSMHGAFQRAPGTGVRPRVLVWLLAAALLGWVAPAPAEPPVAPPAPPPGSPPAAPEAPASSSTVAQGALVIGVFDVTADTVVDGDTVRLPGQPSLRVLGLDCEEVFRAAKDRADAAADFAAYAQAKRGASRLPVKYATPAGEAARDFVKDLFRGVARMRVERDEVGGHELDLFDRRLGHVLLLGPDGERNLGVEVIRAGHSPYFVKYGRAVRFDAGLAAAQREARTAKRGIWAEEGPAHYPDYDERLRWWEERAAQMDAWRAVPAAPERIELGTEGAPERLATRVGREAVLFGLVRSFPARGPPYVLRLADRRDADVPVVVFDEAVWQALDRAALERRFVTVRGSVTLYRGRPQVEIARAEQVSVR
jgi:endonuclease YncB( thermonuclease family)